MGLSKSQMSVEENWHINAYVVSEAMANSVIHVFQKRILGTVVEAFGMTYHTIVILYIQENYLFIDLQEQAGEENKTLGDKLYNAFVAKEEDTKLEIDNNDLVITKGESRDRIIFILLVCGIFQMVITSLTITAILFNLDKNSTESTSEENLSTSSLYFENAYNCHTLTFQHILGFPKLEEVDVFYHKHNISLTYSFGKGITSISNTSTILSSNAPLYKGFKYQDELYITNGFMKSKMLFRKSNRYHALKDTTPSNIAEFGTDIKSTRYGFGIRVMDYFWVTGGSVYVSFQGMILCYTC